VEREVDVDEIAERVTADDLAPGRPAREQAVRPHADRGDVPPLDAAQTQRQKQQEARR
jgi:hypothetical protein